MAHKKRIAILGSTGSIGKQALEVIEEHPEDFEAEILTAWCNVPLLAEQARKFKPNAVVIGQDHLYERLLDELSDQPDIKIFAGPDALEQVVTFDTIDLVLTAMVGFAGLRPTLSAIEAGKDIALANKETLVVGGELVIKAALRKRVKLLPVDSEHSAIFQCLSGEFHNPIEKIILTGSGGPFRKLPAHEFPNISPEQALKHPTWNMGKKITIDSASLMNKGLEVIEAAWLFNLKPHQIEVILHPQSIIHSLVQFEDGSIKAQMGLPSMKLPILYAFSYPKRLPAHSKRFDFSEYASLEFEQPDTDKFPALKLAYGAMERGGNAPCVLNAANEEVVYAFLRRQIGFDRIPVIIEQCLEKIVPIAKVDLESLIETDKESRALAKEIIKKQS